MRPMPSQGSVPFLSRAKVPRYLLRGQPGASSATGKGHPCPELQLLWWLGRDTQPHLQTPNTLPKLLGSGVCDTQEKTSAGITFGAF